MRYVFGVDLSKGEDCTVRVVLRIEDDGSYVVVGRTKVLKSLGLRKKLGLPFLQRGNISGHIRPAVLESDTEGPSRP